MSKCIKEEVRTVMLGNLTKEVAIHLALIEENKGNENFVVTVVYAMVGIIRFMADCDFISTSKAIEYSNRFIDKANEIVNA